MERYKDHMEWMDAVNKAEQNLKELKDAAPNYYKYFKEIDALNEDGWIVQRMDTDPHRDRTIEVNVNVFKEKMKEWAIMSFKDSKKIWELVKSANTGRTDDEIYDKRFNTQRMYTTIIDIQLEIKNERA